jgi:hypothetical protein
MDIGKVKIKDSKVSFNEKANNNIMSSKKKTNRNWIKRIKWQYILLFFTTMSALFTAIIKSKIQGNENVTVVGSIKINNQNAWSEDIKRVFVKGQTLGGQNTLSNNQFVLRDVNFKADKIIEIVIELRGKDNLSHSALFKLPIANSDNVSDVGEVLIEIKSPEQTYSKNKIFIPKIVIVNKNVIQNNTF